MIIPHEAFETIDGRDKGIIWFHIPGQIGHVDVICKAHSEDRGRIGATSIGEGVS